MKIKVTKNFSDKLNSQVNYIAKDKPSAARKFKEEIMLRIKGIANRPYQNRKSIFLIAVRFVKLFTRAILLFIKLINQKTRLRFLDL